MKRWLTSGMQEVCNDQIAFRKFRNYFVSYSSLVLVTDNEWKLINNLAIVELKEGNEIRLR